MLKRIPILLLLIFASTLSVVSKTNTKTAVYKKPDTNKPARILASQIDLSGTTIKIEKYRVNSAEFTFMP